MSETLNRDEVLTIAEKHGLNIIDKSTLFAFAAELTNKPLHYAFDRSALVEFKDLEIGKSYIDSDGFKFAVHQLTKTSAEGTQTNGEEVCVFEDEWDEYEWNEVMNKNTELEE